MNATNKNTTPTHHHRSGILRKAIGGLAAIALGTLSATAGSTHQKGAFSTIVSFGDSLSDLGNFYRATGGTVPPFPYFEGRASNGPLWIEYLAEKLHTPLETADQYAWFGALSGNTNFRDVPAADIYFPGFQQQIDAFVATTGPGGADPDALYTVWIGANDVLAWIVMPDKSAQDLITTGVGRTVQSIVDLAATGARHFVVGNLPDFGLTPTVLASGPEVSEMLTELSFTYNFVLESQLAHLEDALGIFITRLDAFAIINELSNDPGFFGLSNVTDQAIASYPTSDPDEFLFWDAVHPTTVGHEWVANFVCAGLLKTYAPSNARGKGPHTVRALNGLVNAATHRHQ